MIQCCIILYLKQTAEPGLYENAGDSEGSEEVDEYNGIYDVKGADMNNPLDDLNAFELEKLFEYFRQRGPRAYDDDGYY